MVAGPDADDVATDADHIEDMLEEAECEPVLLRELAAQMRSPVPVSAIGALLISGCGSEQEFRAECNVAVNELVAESRSPVPPFQDTDCPELDQPATPDWVELFNRGRDPVNVCRFKLRSDAYEYSWQLCDEAQELVGCDGVELGA